MIPLNKIHNRFSNAVVYKKNINILHKSIFSKNIQKTGKKCKKIEPLFLSKGENVDINGFLLGINLIQ
ncbi:hypothetical protein J2S19_004277 [Metabacillus malikii]|uniref:Uncharacterized protein n=1 Tax=Metabacillus malikii TaxID=1504265 RepID=A0ABT9ZN38_9BACI|nr:hypothetical protein [Metabacillus malikii]